MKKIIQNDTKLFFINIKNIFEAINLNLRKVQMAT